MITQERLKELLHYDPNTGEFRWLVDRSNGYGKIQVHAGNIAGSIRKDGRREIRIDGKLYLTNRLAWLYMTGVFPKLMIDHEDTDTGNDRWENLREATNAQNQMNKGVRRDNKLGVKGVRQLRSGKYQAQIRAAGKLFSLGTRDTAEEAAELYAKAANDHHREFARTI